MNALKPIAGRVPVVKQVDFEGQPHHGLWYIIHANDPTCMRHLRTDGKWHNGTGSYEEGYWPTEAAALAFARECAARESLNPKGTYMTDKPDGTAKADNDTLADMAAVELLHVLETPIQGRPSATLHNYENARRLVKAALLTVFEAGETH